MFLSPVLTKALGTWGFPRCCGAGFPPVPPCWRGLPHLHFLMGWDLICCPQFMPTDERGLFPGLQRVDEIPPTVPLTSTTAQFHSFLAVLKCFIFSKSPDRALFWNWRTHMGILEELIFFSSLIHPPVSLNPSPWQLLLYSVSTRLLLDFVFQIPLIIDTMHYLCLSLTYFTQHNALKIHPGWCKWQNVLLPLTE